jgi:hypothetical protein
MVGITKCLLILRRQFWCRKMDLSGYASRYGARKIPAHCIGAAGLQVLSVIAG